MTIPKYKSYFFHFFNLIIVCLIILSCSSDKKITSIHKDFILFDDGMFLAPIIIEPNPSEETMEAINDLSHYLFKITGKHPRIISDLKGVIPSSAIWIGFHSNLTQIFPSVDFSFKNPEEILIVSNQKNLAILGKDVIQKFSNKIVQTEFGTSNAIYTFIQDYLGVRWLFPGDLGEYIPLKKTIMFREFEFRYNPRILSRNNLFYRFNKNNNPESKWNKRQRLKLSSLNFKGGHAFKDWWEKYSESHPEYFALQSNGKRELVDIPSRVKLCQSNPMVWNQWLLQVENILKTYPSQTVFNASPNDGYNKGHCTCSNCKTWDSDNMNSKSYTTTDRHIRFANELGKLLQKRFPKKKYFVQLHAYGSSLQPPSKIQPRKNVIISCVANFHLRGDASDDFRSLHMDYYKKWGALTNNILWRPNLGNPVGLLWGLPDIAMHQAKEDFNLILKSGCQGLFFDTFWGYWGTQGPQYYVLAQLAWNPSKNVDSILLDYYQKFYGKAWMEMKEYWDFLEKTRTSFIQKYPTRYRAFYIPNVYTEAWFHDASELLSKAEMRFEFEKGSQYSKRVQFTKFGLDYTKKIVEIRRLMKNEYEINPTPKTRKEILNLWDTIYDLNTKAPKYCISFIAIKNKKSKRLMGLHPDNPLNGKAKWSLKKESGLE